MAIRHPYPTAVKLTGDLYRYVLERVSDKGGFEYVVDCLTDGKKSVRDLALEMIASEEFGTKFVRGRDADQVVALLNRILLGAKLEGAALKLEREKFATLGQEKYVEQLTRSTAFRQYFDEDRVPGTGNQKPPSERHATRIRY